MKILGIILIILALVSGFPLVKEIMADGFGSTSPEKTRIMTGLLIRGFFLAAGLFLTFKKQHFDSPSFP